MYVLEINELNKLIQRQSEDIDKLTSTIEGLEGKIEAYEIRRKNKAYIYFLIFFYFFSVGLSVYFIKY